MRGGALCNYSEIFEGTTDDTYTLGEIIIDGGVYIDKYDPSKIIKVLNYGMHEYYILKMLEHLGFTPEIYGLYSCSKKNSKIMYVVMERIDGTDLLHLLEEEYERNIQENRSTKSKDITFRFVSRFIDEIYELYIILLENGLIHQDLYLQNIILGNNGKVYFIDFEHVIDVGHPVPLSDGLSKKELFENIINRKPIHNPNPANYRNISGGKYEKKINDSKIHTFTPSLCPFYFSSIIYKMKTRRKNVREKNNKQNRKKTLRKTRRRSKIKGGNNSYIDELLKKGVVVYDSKYDNKAELIDIDYAPYNVLTFRVLDLKKPFQINHLEYYVPTEGDNPEFVVPFNSFLSSIERKNKINFILYNSY